MHSLHAPIKEIKKTIINISNGSSAALPPIWLMRQAGRYLPEYQATRKQAGDFLTLCYTPELAAEVTLQPIRRFNFDAAIIFSDILVIPHALGIPLSFEEKKGPVLEALSNPKNISRELDLNILSPIYKALELVKSQLPETTTLIGFAGAPFTLSCYMLEGKSAPEFPTAKKWMYHAPEDFLHLIQALENFIVEHLSNQIKSGAEVVQLFDSWAGILPPALFQKYVIESHTRIIHALKKRHPSIPVFGFPRGIGAQYFSYASQVPVDVLVLDTNVSLSEIKQKTSKPLQGNLDPYLLAYAPITHLKNEVTRIKNEMKNRPFIFNLGHGILPDTPIANVEKLVEWVRE